MEFTHSKDRIFIVADDLGLHSAVNEGIIYLLKNGLISGASLMANGQAFDDALHRCLEVELPNIGIHLVLIEERSLTGMVLPKNHKIFFIRYILGLINLQEVERELGAQLSKCVKAGLKPSFKNSHQHLHLLSGITEIVIRLAREHQIPYIRIVNEPLSLSGGNLFRKLQLLFLNFLSAIAKRKIRKAGLVCNDFFVGFVNAGNLNWKDIGSAEELLKKYSDKIIEFGCHPGYENDELRKKYVNWGGYNWKKELNMLKSQHD